MSKFLVLCILMIPQFVHANSVKMAESFCVGTTLRHVLTDITNYENLHNIPGAKYDLKEIGTLLQMVKSQSRFQVNNSEATDASVWLVLQPTNLTEGRLYPRFLLQCVSQMNQETSFNHVCSMLQDKEHFGLTNFVSHISGTQTGCPNGQVKISYDLTIDTNNQDVQAIKTAALARLGLLAPLAERLFNEELFFKAYFKNLFTSWIQNVQ